MSNESGLDNKLHREKSFLHSCAPSAQQKCSNDVFMRCLTRTAVCNAVVDGEPLQKAHYEIAVSEHGDFAARCLDTGYIIAGYSHGQPLLTIEEAAQEVLSQPDLHTIYIHGDFSTVMCRIINEYYDRFYEKHRNQKYRPMNFPMGRIRPDIR